MKHFASAWNIPLKLHCFQSIEYDNSVWRIRIYPAVEFPSSNSSQPPFCFCVFRSYSVGPASSDYASSFIEKFFPCAFSPRLHSLFIFFILRVLFSLTSQCLLYVVHMLSPSGQLFSSGSYQAKNPQIPGHPWTGYLIFFVKPDSISSPSLPSPNSLNLNLTWLNALVCRSFCRLKKALCWHAYLSALNNLDKTTWNFCPSVGAAYLFVVLFGLTICGHLAQAIIHRKGYCCVIIVSALLQSLTYIFRIISINNPSSNLPSIL